MSERDQAKQIIDRLPDFKISRLLLFLQGVLFDDELEDDLYCQRLMDDRREAAGSDPQETVTLEELAQREGIEL